MPAQERPCAKCGDAPAGPGGVLCEACRAAIEQALDAYRSSGKHGSVS
jgi:hypothetical protein